jgi:prepilin-type N-terminal cleavage/methylation domain-containing protein
LEMKTLTARSNPVRTQAFTLLELLIVIGLIAVICVWISPGLSGGSRAASLQSAQTILANLVGLARTKAVASGASARLLVNIDLASAPAGGRYLRFITAQVQDGAGWDTIGMAWLPEGVGLLPRDPTAPANLLPGGPAWTRPSDDAQLRSSALRPVGPVYPDAEVTFAVDSPTPELWAAIKFTALGTTANAGDLVLASYHVLPPGSYAPGESPLQFENQETVRGLTLSAYGLPEYVNGREGF